MIEIDFSKAPDEYAFRHLKKDFEKKVYSYYYELCRGNQTEMSKIMGVTRSTIDAKIDMYDIKEGFEKMEGWIK